MGLYPIECPKCKKPFLWFSGNNSQICFECDPGVSQSKPVGFNEDGVTHAVVEKAETTESVLRLNITVLEQQLRAEKAGYSLIYEVKEQLREELEREKQKAQILVEALRFLKICVPITQQVFIKAALDKYQEGGGDV